MGACGRARLRVDGATLKGAIRENVDRSSRIMTDEWSSYRGIGAEFDGGHEFVTHSAGEYACGDAHTNTAEAFFALLKRGVIGSFHHVSKQHLTGIAMSSVFGGIIGRSPTRREPRLLFTKAKERANL